MDCVNHTGVNATAFCQSCGKALLRRLRAQCGRRPGSLRTMLDAWHSYQQPFAAPAGSPSPSAAAVLGFDSRRGGDVQRPVHQGPCSRGYLRRAGERCPCLRIFGIFIAAWVVYQSFEAYHTARARRDGQPLPDPLGLNELANSLGAGRGQYPGQPGAGPGAVNPGSPTGQAPSGAGYQTPYQQAPYQQAPYQTPYQGPFGGAVYAACSRECRSRCATWCHPFHQYRPWDGGARSQSAQLC